MMVFHRNLQSCTLKRGNFTQYIVYLLTVCKLMKKIKHLIYIMARKQRYEPENIILALKEFAVK